MRDNEVVKTSASLDQAPPAGRGRFWKALWLALAVVIAVPIASEAYDRILQVNLQSRARLITEHRLWEVHPEFRGKPEAWTRFASRLLNDRQLMTRVVAKYGPMADQIELDYRRDLTIAQAEVVLTAIAVWALPLALLYAIAWAARRRHRNAPQAKIQLASADDPRYMPERKSPNNNGGTQ